MANGEYSWGSDPGSTPVVADLFDPPSANRHGTVSTVGKLVAFFPFQFNHYINYSYPCPSSHLKLLYGLLGMYDLHFDQQVQPHMSNVRYFFTSHY